MRMSVQEALDVLHIDTTPITRDMIKSQKRKLASQYHPDRNPDGLRLMQDVNMAFDMLARTPDYLLMLKPKAKPQPKPNGKPNDGLNVFRDLGLQVEKEHDKTWVGGKTFHHREILKSHGFRWCPDDRAWWRYN